MSDLDELYADAVATENSVIIKLHNPELPAELDEALDLLNKVGIDTPTFMAIVAENTVQCVTGGESDYASAMAEQELFSYVDDILSEEDEETQAVFWDRSNNLPADGKISTLISRAAEHFAKECEPMVHAIDGGDWVRSSTTSNGKRIYFHITIGDAQSAEVYTK